MEAAKNTPRRSGRRHVPLPRAGAPSSSCCGQREEPGGNDLGQMEAVKEEPRTIKTALKRANDGGKDEPEQARKNPRRRNGRLYLPLPTSEVGVSREDAVPGESLEVPPDCDSSQVPTNANLLQAGHQEIGLIQLQEVKAEPKSAKAKIPITSHREKAPANVVDAAVPTVGFDHPCIHAHPEGAGHGSDVQSVAQPNASLPDLVARYGATLLSTPPGFKPGDAKWGAHQCTKCSISNPGCYWDHGPDKGKCFVQVLKRSCRRRLVLNDRFFDFFRSAVAELVRLQLRNGEYYDVNVVREGYRCVLEQGWDRLCKHHNLKGGDMAVFTYHGPSEFHLRLFDHGGIEVSSSFVRPWCYPVQESQTSLPAGIQRKYVLSRNVAPAKELEDAIAAVGHGDLPSYVFRITETNINKGVLYFSKEYTSRCVLQSVGSMLLVKPGENVGKIARVYTGSDGIARITTGWKDFARDNGIKTGCVCMIKLSEESDGGGMRCAIHVLSWPQ